jgi:hypothetical protein
MDKDKLEALLGAITVLSQEVDAWELAKHWPEASKALIRVYEAADDLEAKG